MVLRRADEDRNRAIPIRRVAYLKSDEKPPFQNREQVKRQSPGLPPAKVEELWEWLYLTVSEIEPSLAHLKERATHP